MRISDWSSDVCSSDLDPYRRHQGDEYRKSGNRVASRPLAIRRAAAAVHRCDGSYPERIEGANCLCRPYATKQRLSCYALAACISSRHLLNATCQNIAGNQYVNERSEKRTIGKE